MSAAGQPTPAYRTPLPIRRALFLAATLLAMFLVLVGAYEVLDVSMRQTDASSSHAALVTSWPNRT